MAQLVQEIIARIKHDDVKSQRQLNYLKRDVAKSMGSKFIPSNMQILLSMPEKEISHYIDVLLTKPTRTISGVSPVALMTKPDKCPHGKCTFCPGGIDSPWGDVPQSYTGHEPATMRGIRNEYDAYLQVFNRLQQYVLLGQSFDKIEIIVMGGTFTATPISYQNEFIYNTFKAMNDFAELFCSSGELDYIKFKEFFELPGDIYDKVREENIKEKVRTLKEKNSSTSLQDEQLRNETAYVRCVALCVETKPDWGFLDHGNIMLQQGCTRVELGIQSMYDDVLKITHRGHDSKDSIASIRILRDLGFKINFHYMPGLPLTDEARDVAGMRQMFSDPDYKPDMIKMYPCMVGPGTPLFEQWKKGEFTPITTKEAAKRIAIIMNEIPEYCRVQRVQRDVPTKFWEAGVDRTNLRQFMNQNFEVKSRDIRAREPKGVTISWEDVTINVMKYPASQGVEFFIAAEDTKNDVLIGFARLRFPSTFLRSEITKSSALLRELHVYGTATAIGATGNVQHKGWGKKLMAKAEEIATSRSKDKMVVISGVGVKEYYKKLGYVKEGPYMVKGL